MLGGDSGRDGEDGASIGTRARGRVSVGQTHATNQWPVGRAGQVGRFMAGA